MYAIIHTKRKSYKELESMEERNRIERPQYLQTLKQYRDMPLVKILAGIRRCGKSTILEMLKEELIRSGI